MGGVRVLRRELIAPIFHEAPSRSNRGASEAVLLVGAPLSNESLTHIANRVNAVKRHYSIAHPYLVRLYWRRFSGGVGTPRPTGITLGRYALDPNAVSRFSREDLNRFKAIPVTIRNARLIIAKKRGDQERQAAYQEMMMRMRAQTFRVIEVAEEDYERGLAAEWGSELVFVP